MSYFPMSEYKFIKFEKSNRKHKKYNAIIQNKITKKNVKIPFGDNRYEQFLDITGLGAYSHKNHLDIFRRENYRKRHKTFLKHDMFSAGFFSYYFLW